jgi:hypothetical protein
MKKQHNFSKLKELKNPYAGKEKGRGDQLEPGSGGLFQGAGAVAYVLVMKRAFLTTADRSLASRLREEAQQTDHEGVGVARRITKPKSPTLPSRGRGTRRGASPSVLIRIYQNSI